MSAKKPKMMTQGFIPATIPSSIDRFVRQINSLRVALPAVMTPLGESYGTIGKRIKTFIDTKALNKKEEGNRIQFTLKESDDIHFAKLRDEQISAALGLRNVPQTFLVALVSQYDAYIGNLLRSCFALKPEMLNASQRQLTYTELLALSDLNAARDQLIEKEVETVLRSSHADHFAWLEARLAMPLRKELSIWPTFIELTERRNLFVHCDGVISRQYIQVCKEHGVSSIATAKVGDLLDVDSKYFTAAYDCLFELGVKLGHVLWRKLQPEKLEEADDHLNTLAFDLLADTRYELANTLLEFACKTLKKHSSDIARRVFIINHCIALKNLKKPEYIALLDKEDWSACRDDFVLAVSVLKDDFDLASKLMVAIGRNGKPADVEYRTWPLFREFRKSDQFKRAFKKIFKKDFVLEEELPEATTVEKSREQASGSFK